MIGDKQQLFSLAIILAFFLPPQPNLEAQVVSPTLEFPRQGLDDSVTYRGYTTRFFQDSAGNTLQIYLNQNEGRVVNVWADAANESIGFTARTPKGEPVRLQWAGAGARMTSNGKTRYVEYTLLAPGPTVQIGHFILNTMRIEREFQYFKRHTEPFGSEPFIASELTDLIANIERLPRNVSERHLALLSAPNADALRTRLVPKLERKTPKITVVTQPTFDGKNNLSLEIIADAPLASLDVLKDKITISSGDNQPFKLTLKIGTDSPPLTPLSSKDIFNDGFFRFYERAKSARLERQVKSMELMSSEEKLLAGLPNYATYFGRDMMMSALMLQPVLKPAMLEHVISSVLKKLTANGEVSHEEGLGAQAIRENAARYNQLLVDYFQLESPEAESAIKILKDAEIILSDLRKTTENYHMIDDDFQLAVLTARYLTDENVSALRKRTFLKTRMDSSDNTSHLTLLLRNLRYVSNITRAYIEDPVTLNLVSFEKRGDHDWRGGSWRDSSVGYANGRYAMDVNAIWVREALQSIGQIFSVLSDLGFTIADLQTLAPEIENTPLMDYAQKPETLRRAEKIWCGAMQHFEVRFEPQEVAQRVHDKLNWLPAPELAYWKNLLDSSAADKQRIEFLALALNEEGKPIPVANTDIATWLFLENLTAKVLADELKPKDVLARLKIFVVPYPVGLFIEGVGQVAANDAYASSDVWESYERDLYHSPRTIWGREVNLLLLGLARQIQSAYDSKGQIKDTGLDAYVRELRAILHKTLAAVESSGLKYNELWSYSIDNGNLLPARYGTTSDIQLWNLTDLAVQFLFDRL